METLFAAMRPNLEHSDIVFEFLGIARRAPILPSCALQKLMVFGAVEITPPWAREILGLGAAYGLPLGGESLLRAAGALSDKVVIANAPPAQACIRMGLGATFLYR